MDEELYFCLKLTEAEHDIMENHFRVLTTMYGVNCTVLYYRKLKDGHIPMWREIKVVGNKEMVNRFRDHAVNFLRLNLQPNPHKAPYGTVEPYYGEVA